MNEFKEQGFEDDGEYDWVLQKRKRIKQNCMKRKLCLKEMKKMRLY